MWRMIVADRQCDDTLTSPVLSRSLSQAYANKGKSNPVHLAAGIALGMMVILGVYYVHSSRAAAELAAHHAHTHDVLHRHRMDEHVSDREHAEMLAKHGMHETDEDLRMHALEFFEHDNNKDAFHAGPDATKVEPDLFVDETQIELCLGTHLWLWGRSQAEIESMDKNNDGAVSWKVSLVPPCFTGPNLINYN